MCSVQLKYSVENLPSPHACPLFAPHWVKWITHGKIQKLSREIQARLQACHPIRA
jgi:hypothetical protein